MRALIQRVTAAQVVIDESIVGKIDTGMLVLVCAMPKDDVQTADNLAAKIAKLRIFQDEDGRMNKSIKDTDGSALVAQPIYACCRYAARKSARVLRRRRTRPSERTL